MEQAVRRIAVTGIAALVAVIGVASPAPAAKATKASVLLSWTKPTKPSYTAWDVARKNQLAWSRYEFDWTTDFCSSSPDTPLGFDFRMPCWRHDFGYRNYKKIGEFPANKERVDQGFYADLKAVCAEYQGAERMTCLGLARMYYQAVDVFGNIRVTGADLERVAAEARATPSPVTSAPATANR